MYGLRSRYQLDVAVEETNSNSSGTGRFAVRGKIGNGYHRVLFLTDDVSFRRVV